jgi:hypothetical protein
MVVSRPTPLHEVARALEVPLEIEEGLTGMVRLTARGHSLARVFDSLARQVHGQWVTELDLHPRPRAAVDAAAADEERRRWHFGDLSRLSSEEVQEEVLADVEAIEQLPPEQRGAAVQQMVRDVLSLATVYGDTPGEHRGPVAPLVLGIARDYASALSGLPDDRRRRFTPVMNALSALADQLARFH